MSLDLEDDRRRATISAPCKPIDLEWERLTVATPTTKTITENGKTRQIVDKKVILKEISGCFQHGKVTAVIGPSGSGKTTLLNFLAGRTSNQLEITGSLKVNSHPLKSFGSISNLVAYIQQDDILLTSFTPRELLTFSANLKLNRSAAKKKERIEQVLQDLNLVKCADTRVGTVEDKGLSGGERKRTSIAIDLITNPSLIFLDEPTTGLDSTTALSLLEALERLAANGRTIISTIHQPSTEIFYKFDNLLLLTKGNIIYQGPTRDAVRYFQGVGYYCPNNTNPADYFLNLLCLNGMVINELKVSQSNKANIQRTKEIEFEQRIDQLVLSYKNSPLRKNFQRGICTEPVHSENVYQVSWFYQFFLIMIRAFKNEIRNPMNSKTIIFQTIFVIFLVNSLYHNLGNGETGIQNRLGVLFMLVSMSGFTAVTGSIGTFSQEKAVFTRERFSKYYSTGAYFWAKSISELPFSLFYPILLIAPVYWFIGLNTRDHKFLITFAFHILVWLAGSAYGLLLSIIIPNLEFALAFVPALLVPLVVVTGFFVNQSKIPFYYKPLEYLSIFKWTFQGTTLNEFTDLKLDCSPYCDPLKTLNFQQDLKTCLILLAAIAAIARLLAYLGLLFISRPKGQNKIIPLESDKLTNISMNNNEL